LKKIDLFWKDRSTNVIDRLAQSSELGKLHKRPTKCQAPLRKCQVSNKRESEAPTLVSQRLTSTSLNILRHHILSDYRRLVHKFSYYSTELMVKMCIYGHKQNSFHIKSDEK